ncbi:hypothetical protein [Bacillus sp. B1-b2]|uniref:hypothetical protein n=1 Tax=Bacillus sp. B1-b2 TaxID=2653201 RepID=UPI0012621EE9|nr:hypothetical protein [Bacillus sp. B1-b2]KAB7672511.1 hypothetical protein F9279_02460 [Bacillus sp. B1-b2]
MNVFSYYVITRTIDYSGQLSTEIEKTLILQDDKISSAEKTFPLDTIYDISYKQSINTYKILYLHTNHGVYSFVIKDDPEEWIELIKEKLNNK